MKRTLVSLFFAAMVAQSAFAIAVMQPGKHVTLPPVRSSHAGNNLDVTCTISFIGFTYGTNLVSMQWPGGGGDYYVTGFAFLNSCTPGETLYTYCSDVYHPLQTSPYCVNIDPMVIRQLYPEQATAFAYVMSQYPVATTLDDEIMQLAIWKLSDDRRSGPTFGEPLYHINAFRGYPNISDPPVYPYVNTVYSFDPAVNAPACVRVLDALGYGPDGIAKNVIMCDDQITLIHGAAVVDGDTGRVPVTIQLTRGPSANPVHNVSRSGVRIVLHVTGGVLNTYQVFTNALGQAQIVVSQALASPLGSHVTVCSYGLWPNTIQPCAENEGQQMLVQGQTQGALCSLCVSTYIPPDEFLPVELAFFEAASGEHGIDLMWRSASETNLRSWEVQRRKAGESDFQTTAALPATNSADGHSYRFTDASVETGVRYDYRLADVAVNGTRTIHSGMIRSAAWNTAELLTGFQLGEAYPNPFNPETTIRFSIAEAGRVTLKVYDVTGKNVANLVDDRMNAGQHAVLFRAGDLPSGLYFYTLSSGSFTQTRKLILLK